MTELTARDRLQPALLDRLIDNAPDSREDTPEDRVVSRKQLRAAVLRDLSWLLNTVQAEGTRDPVWRRVDLARHSVLNFGVPAFTGKPLSQVGNQAVADAVRRAILDFEPRVLPDSLEVTATRQRGGHANSLRINIRGMLWGQPVPLELMLAAEIDCESGVQRVIDLRS